jgi:hypothetical protein
MPLIAKKDMAVKGSTGWKDHAETVAEWYR